MDDQNGNCFDHHADLFAPLPVSDNENDCLKDFLLEPSRPLPLSSCSLETPLEPAPPLPWQCPQVPYPGYMPPETLDPVAGLVPPLNQLNSYGPTPLVDNSYGPSTPVETPEAAPSSTNGDCWSPATFTASTSERTVSSDCVSSEVCSPSENAVDSPLPIIKPCSVVVNNNIELGLIEPSIIEPPPKSKRGRKRKSEAHKARPRNTVATYESQISPDQNGIKLKIKKSFEQAPPRTRKKREKYKDDADSYEEPSVQSAWGSKLPHRVMYKIFELITRTEGCVPFLVRVSRVCRLWREVAISPSLWRYVDLSQTWVKDRGKNDLKFRWLCENRLQLVHDLNIGGWEFDGIPSILDKMASSCGEMRGLSLTGWQGLSAENIKFLVSKCPKLQRLDLSCISPEMNNPRSAVSQNALVFLAQEMTDRLTQLVLSDNKLSGLPQVITAISSCCPHLEVLDLSNVRTVSHTTVPFHVEKLQQGCPRLRVLRITNSELALAPVPLKEQSLSEGFPELEELSVAGVVGDICSKPVIDDDSLLRILKSSHKLRLLDVRGCSRLTDSSLVRVPAWDLEHLFLSGCYVTRLNDSGLELICQKWAHSLVEVDLAWSTATEPLDAAVRALASHAQHSPLRSLNLCGSSVSMDPVRTVLKSCSHLSWLNLSSCRALPRGIKRLYQGSTLDQLKTNVLKEQPQKESDQQD